ncbi:hypothetical protein DM02DRAFT_549062 [Periconia macrospinosa]|uniref:C2H2-type domain-containing protein n=1 Tax=Periconia macrospinosa TaxID=97972 RepID=A0A2V1EFV2_9PLEO|nr:hypothetical protein DM02DRAFT_549062 [Periconia macrospinosa]
MDSDYDQESDDVSDDEYLGSKPTAATRAAGAGGNKAQKSQAPKAHAWARRGSTPPDDEGEYLPEEGQGTNEEPAPVKSIQHMEEDRKRKRLRKDTKPFQRGIIRHVVLVLDLSEAMLEKDMRPSRYAAMIRYTQEYVREFFEQNPISQMSVLGMHDGLCIRFTKCIGASEGNIISYAKSWDERGYRGIRVPIITRSGRCTPDDQSMRTRTNAGDESEYVVATDQELLRELLLATTTPPVVRATNASRAAPESSAALMMMGFPSRVIEDIPSLCACHGVLTTGGYTCSRCSAKVCSLPVTCPSCQLTLLLSTHLARSYHHLFPLRNWAEVSWQRARETGSKECISCLSAFPEPPPPEDIPHSPSQSHPASNGNHTNGAAAAAQLQAEDEDAEQKASESSRYECRVCESHFCIDCDMFCHMVLHNCPGCLIRIDYSPRRRFSMRGRMAASFDRLIRFEADDGKVYYGDLGDEVPTREIEGRKVQVLDGDVKSGFKKSGGEVKVSKLLCPLPTTNIIMCVGLNYNQHAEECNLSVPTFPTIFTKPPDALAGPLDPIPIHADCQSQLDYEGELTIVIGRDAKNVPASSFAEYVLGYTVGNDVSARNFQMPASISGGQFGYAKSFDKFAPIGPCIASTNVVGDPQKLRYWTKVNGEKRQETGTDDMIWTAGQIVEHLSRGTTLRAGTCIMTGTPSGVGLFMEPKGFLKDGDEVEIYAEGIGSLINKVKFDTSRDSKI